jgi:hypothetical protein
MCVSLYLIWSAKMLIACSTREQIRKQGLENRSESGSSRVLEPPMQVAENMRPRPKVRLLILHTASVFRLRSLLGEFMTIPVCPRVFGSP